MSRPPLFRSALWVRERACAPLVAVETPGAAPKRARAAAVAELSRPRRRKGTTTRRAA